MSKYTYRSVEHLSDLDITGATTYYLFEEGVGHGDFYFKECTVEQLETLIGDRRIYTREEKPWWERIPPKGVLCWDKFSECYRLIVKYRVDCNDALDCSNDSIGLHDLTPLTNEQIKEFLQEEE